MSTATISPRPSTAEQFAHPFFGAPDDGRFAPNYNRSLQKSLVPGQDVDYGLWISHVVGRIEFELRELGVFPDEVLNRVFERGHEALQRGLIRWLLHVENHFVFDAELLSDR